MLASPHLPQLRNLRRWPAPKGRATVALALVLFAGVFALRMSDAHVGDGEGILYAVPIGMLALRFGLRGSLCGALLAFALTVAWGQLDAHVIPTPLGYATRGVALLTLGALFGAFVDHRRGLEAGVLRYYDGSLDLLATTDLSGRFTRVNPAWERTLGYSAETLCAGGHMNLVHPDDREATIAEIEALVESSHEIVGFRNRYRASDGSYRWLEWSASVSRSESVIHAVARDVTAQHEAEDQLANNARSLETMVAERTAELDEARAETLRRLAIAAEYRDDETYRHTERVGAVAARIGLGLGLPAAQIRLLRQAAPLHDVGKLAIPDGILLKPGKLTAKEREVMQTHAALGSRLLSGSNSPVLQMAAVIAATHHERWDGQGYPNGLSGETIPLVGRVVAVADVFDALIHDRPYKSAWPLDRAIAEIERASGSQFDPRVVATFLTLHHEGGEAGVTNGRPQIDSLSWNNLVGSYG
jgi:PAS domain S-box-containing protein